jgi:hypothetical protein
MKLLSASVGKVGSNRAEDVITVKKLLNSIPFDKGGAGGKLTENGSIRWDDETVAAITRFQQMKVPGINPDGVVKPGGKTWNRLNELNGTSAPPAAPQPVAPTIPKDHIPPPYDTLPEPLKATIRRTYNNKTKDNSNFAWEMGFKDVKEELTLGEVLKKLEDNGHLDVIKAVYNRSLIEPKLWPSIKEILNIWTYAGGNQISQGFNYTCDTPDTSLLDMRASNRFCEDNPSTTVHGPRDCFRELITAGEGLHVCITRKDARGTENHDIHIDKYQVVCTKKRGYCDYKYFDQNFVDHIKDVIPWWLDKKLKELPTPEFKPPERGPKW